MCHDLIDSERSYVQVHTYTVGLAVTCSKICVSTLHHWQSINVASVNQSE